MHSLYSRDDFKRRIDDGSDSDGERYRTAWRRDYARLIHSPSFRRLQGKTQVFPGQESDFYRNRLTHSLEVAQIARSIALRINATNPAFGKKKTAIDPDIIEFAALAHDLGHPPFGHNGEEALDECMVAHGGFEGNAQSLRLVSRIEKKAVVVGPNGEIEPFREGEDQRRGLNLTYRSMAALLKYDTMIAMRQADRKHSGVNKGYYADDATLVSEIKNHVVGRNYSGSDFKTIECSIMDIADDIAYSTYDLEDNFKAGFLHPIGLFSLSDDIYSAVAETIKSRAKKQYGGECDADAIDSQLVLRLLQEVFQDILFGFPEQDARKVKSAAARNMTTASKAQLLSLKLASSGYHRQNFTSQLVHNAIQNIEVVPHADYLQLYRARLSFNSFLIVEVLKNITYHAIIKSPNLQVVQYRGKDIIKEIFQALKEEDGIRLLPSDFASLCRGSSEDVKMRTICDFIAGMTDRYAFEFYERLFGSAYLTVHKPF